jgi:sugar O-acyltransferase (sialic acid O-acetyltransferase NeuD family)
MLLYGASGHSKVILSCLRAQGVKVNGLFDENPEIKNLLEYDVVGVYDPGYMPDVPLIISIGNNLIRKRVCKNIQHGFGRAFHTTAIIDKDVLVGEGSVVMHNAVLQSGTRVGKHAIINTSVTIDHDCEVGDFAHISPGATICGNTKIGEGTHIGAGASIIPNLRIGKWVTIGAGSVIICDIPDYAVVVGNPGKIIKYRNERSH